RSPLIGIDLNEIPSASLAETLTDSIEVVRAFHDNPDPSPGAPAAIPGEGMDSECGVCGLPEERGHVVVCDGCERGFHLGCAEIRGRQAVNLGEWLCGECVNGGVNSKRWPLGIKSKRILDINASPPSDGDGEASEELQNLRKHSAGDDSFGGNAFGGPVRCSNFMYTGNGFGFQKDGGVMAHAINLGLDDIMHHTHIVGENLEEIDLGFLPGRHCSSAAGRFQSRNPSEILLQALREFVSERHGVLDEGWHVELKQSTSSDKLYAVYSAPDGRTFDSVAEVARYLGLTLDNEIKAEGSPLWERLPKGRKSTIISIGNSFFENKEKLGNGYCKELFSDVKSTEIGADKLGYTVKVTEAVSEDNDWSGSQQTKDGFPVQFEDFFIFSLGQVDARPSYHDHSMICPVGYRSCWHDKLTGSLFMCEVSDGGDSGPVFKVKRCSCSALPVPVGSTILFKSNLGQNNGETNDYTYYSKDCDNGVSIQLILSDPCPPKENDILTCLGNALDEGCDVETIDNLQLATSSIHGKLSFTQLAKFCSFPASLSIPSVYRGDSELEFLSDSLSKWLDQDRFGLDMEFVQEFIEQLPGVESCSQYEFLKNRNHYSASLTVGNGNLMLQRQGVEGKDEEASDGISRRPKRRRLVKDHSVDDCCPPSGKPVCLSLPPELVGDFHQVCEFLWRFTEVLGLKEPFLPEELEGELINPWFDGCNLSEKFEKEIQGTEVLNPHKNDCISEKVVSSSIESSMEVSRENPHAFVQMDTLAKKEAAQTRLAAVTYSRCSGVALTKIHSLLLGELMSELQSKVAPHVDPNLDYGESKSKRGRKKDVDNSIPAKRCKLNLLPINELTWPELARRYILAVLSMDGNLDSAEITARESGKVFRCLQGDGGILSGSLTGLAGMEADALLLAEATKKIFGSLNRENDVLAIEDEGSDATGACEKNSGSNGSIPDWAQVLESVRKLPTNVGTRIRKCVYEALEKGPPEWAKKRLEHSISKEVYKGNASGPTKKAVLSVLADVCSEGLQQKSDKGSKKKKFISISDTIMKQCRIVLRRAAAADDGKVFCNLLGRKLLNSSDNDDEGLLGSPAMVSRPLDFRTIDLRLAVGAYGGSHDAFLEDVRELWNNVRTAFGDQTELLELAEALSQNFESLYEKEVVSLVQKFVGYNKLECLSVEIKKEIKDVLASTSEIPKAPWDEGVCKVCGIDKDDVSVLLCDTCDAEYHTYCLSPPLASIPEGNWYCPSCATGTCNDQDASDSSEVFRQKRSKEYKGEVSRVFLEALVQLAAVMEENEYWDLSVDERVFLLKFLCDELLNSTLIRQHLEQCAETMAELQQKLRSSSVEWKNLKSREEIVAARAAKVDTHRHNAIEDVPLKEGLVPSHTNHDKCKGHSHNGSDGTNNLSVSSDGLPQPYGFREGTGVDGVDKHLSVTYSEKNHTCNSPITNYMDTGDQLKDVNGIVHYNKVSSPEIDKPFRPNHQGLCLPSDVTSVHVTEHVPSVSVDESQACHVELSAIKNDILLLQHSITSVESQILKLSVRREFLGSDSGGQLYWATSTPGQLPRIIVDGSLAVQQRRNMPNYIEQGNSIVMQNSTMSGLETRLNLEGPKACCPFLYEPNSAMVKGPPWVSYQTDAEIAELINWLDDNYPKERELKESIFHWQKLRIQDSQQNRNQAQEENLTALSMPPFSEKDAHCSCLITKAATLLEKKYGSCTESETIDLLKKQGKKARVTNVEKMYRCECLEPIWPSRNHCISCHRTFFTKIELEEHIDGSCNPDVLAPDKRREINDSFKGKVIIKPGATRAECTAKKDDVDYCKSGCSEFSSRLIKFQTDGLVCPYEFEEISSMFLTEGSNKELVQEIGLIGSNGIPSFVQSKSSYLSDSILMLTPQMEVGIVDDKFRAAEKLVFSQGDSSITSAVQNGISDQSSRRSATNETCELPKNSSLPLGKRGQKSSLNNQFPEMGVGRCCIVPKSSMKPLVGKVSQILRRLKINLLDIDAALPEEALRPSKVNCERRWAWRACVKSANTIYEMVQAIIILEDMIKTDYLRKEWWYWSSLSAAAKTSTLSSLALRIYSLDAAVVYEMSLTDIDPTDNMKPSCIPDQKPLPRLDLAEKCKVSRKSTKKRKEPEC
ncbi:Bromodomain domain-containing protein/PHD domain-containing protein/MBD domain-containing protein/FYRN domain-containing protein/FYRC domain-containing protein, partial [Cephalotus follicularis]